MKWKSFSINMSHLLTHSSDSTSEFNHHKATSAHVSLPLASSPILPFADSTIHRLTNSPIHRFIRLVFAGGTYIYINIVYRNFQSDRAAAPVPRALFTIHPRFS